MLLRGYAATANGMTIMADQLSKAIAEIGDDDRLRDVVAAVQRLTGMRFAAIAYVSEDRWIASLVEGGIELGLLAGSELAVRQTLCDEVRRYNCEIIIDDCDNDPDWAKHPVPDLYGFKSYVSIPIFVGGMFFGTLCALDPTPRERPLAEVRNALLALAAEAGRLLMERMRRERQFPSRFPPIQ